MRNRPLLSLALSALAAGILVAPATTAAIKLPKGVKIPKVTQYPVTIDAVGYLDYRWTYDSTKSCVPGHAETIDESLSFELGRPRATKVGVVNGKVIVPPVIAGEATVQTELVSWKTSNYCPPDSPAPEPPEPVCKKKLRSRMVIAVGPVKEEIGPEDPAPLAYPTQVAIGRPDATPQNRSCTEDRPKIKAESEGPKGWLTDPYVGAVAPLGATDVQFRNLKLGQALKRTIEIGGGCGKATFRASASASIPSTIKSCVLKGKIVVTIKRTGKGFST